MAMMMAQMEQNRALYVGNLDPSVTEDLIMMLFGQLGEVRSCKMFRDPTADPYCFLEFNDHVTALNAITMMNDKMLQNRKMRVDWATGQANKNKYTKVDTSRHHHVYVGDLSPEIDEQGLREAFQVFGEISDCKVVKDPQTFKSRGYGFVMFVKKMDAETAISTMNGQWLGRKMIKIRWATRKPTNAPNEYKPEQKKLNYDEVFNQTTPTNTTVFCGGLKQDITEEMLHAAFQSHGQIEMIKIFKEKGYAFIKYTTKENACQAIVDLHNSTLNGQWIQCSWGKDRTAERMAGGPPGPPDANGGAQTGMPSGYPNGQAQYNQGGQMGYWPYYPQQMGYNQMYNQYPQYTGYQQPNPGYMWMGWGQQQQQQQQGWGAPGQPGGPQQPGQPPKQ